MSRNKAPRGHYVQPSFIGCDAQVFGFRPSGRGQKQSAVGVGSCDLDGLLEGHHVLVEISAADSAGLIAAITADQAEMLAAVLRDAAARARAGGVQGSLQ